jgi:malonyl CoA-acyl carrier protein transacylase
MKVFVYPGQGAQFSGMGKSMYEENKRAKELFEEANDILGFRITDIMFSGTDDELKQTQVTQPAVFLHSVILSKIWGKLFTPGMVAGHSLGEFSALTAANALSFEDGLTLVSKRAHAMQKACELRPSTMAAIIGMADEAVENVCAEINDEVIVCANFNCPGQIVISGTEAGVDKACEMLTAAGAKRALKLKVGGAFHSPLMEPARAELAEAINATTINAPICPIYQNFTALPATDPVIIKENLIAQLTAPVKWTQTVKNMVADGADHFVEHGPGKILQGLILKIDNSVTAESYQEKITLD